MARSAIIHVHALRVSCIVGILPHEREVEQTLEIDIDARCDVERAAATDAIEHALDYTRLAAVAQAHLVTGRYGLLEAAAAGLSAELRRAFPDIEALRVRLRKPGALGNAAWCGITCEDGRWADLP